MYEPLALRSQTVQQQSSPGGVEMNGVTGGGTPISIKSGNGGVFRQFPSNNGSNNSPGGNYGHVTMLESSPTHQHMIRKQPYAYASLPLAYQQQQQQQQQHEELLYGYADVGTKTLQQQQQQQQQQQTPNRYQPQQQLLRPRPIYAHMDNLSRTTSYSSSVDLISSSGIGNSSTSSSRRGSSSSDPRSNTRPMTTTSGGKSPASQQQQTTDDCCLCSSNLVEDGAFVLPCQHCLCKKCVDKMMTSSLRHHHHHAIHHGEEGKQLDLVVLHCPVCREAFSIDRKASQQGGQHPQAPTPEGKQHDDDAEIRSFRKLKLDVDDEEIIIRNDSVVDVDITTTGTKTTTNNNSTDQQQQCQYCDGETPLPARHMCMTCRVFYCDVCLRTTHPRKKPFTNHQIRDVSESVMPSQQPSRVGVGGGGGTEGSVPVVCYHHPQKSAEVYCSNCDKLLCKTCGLLEHHDGHYMCNLHEWSRAKKIGLENDVTRVNKQTGELKRVLETLQESYRQIEVAADHHENKLQTECDVLIRIVRDRCDVMSSKIKENKAAKLRVLSQEIGYVRDTMETVVSAVMQAKECCKIIGTIQNSSVVGGENEDNKVDLHRFNNKTKAASDRLSDALNMAKQVLCNSNYDVTTHQSSNFTLDFAKERSVLEKLNLLEPPSLPRICDELCTQSHDKVTLQWRSVDQENIDRYELQYAIDNHQSSQVKSDNWMIVPNIRDSHYTLHGLQSGTKYIFAVRSINKAGSNLSDIIPIKTLGMPFHFDVHSIHKKLRIVNHNYTVLRDESQSSKTKHDTSLYGVTGNVTIDSGRHYWEVVVCQSTIYTLGVALADVARYDWVGKNNKSWVLSRNNQTWSAKHDGKETILITPLPYPKKIGILLNFDNGMLSFFDGASGRRLHTFTPGNFPKPLRPSFALNNRSLTINTGIVVPDHLQLPSMTSS